MTGDPQDPFDRIKAQRAASTSASGKPGPDQGEIVAPIPADAPVQPRHRRLGEASRKWTYRDADGLALFHVARFDLADGSKEVLPLTLWREAKGQRWRWKAFPEPRPLYGLAELATKPDAPVLIVEGEKTADAARVLWPELAVVTWPGGSRAQGKVDWSPLAGRRTVIFPDADAAGRAAAEDVAAHARAASAQSAAIVELPEGLPAKWDLADPFPPGFDQATANRLIREAQEAAARSRDDVEWPAGYRMEADGLYCEQLVNGRVVPVQLSAPFEVLGEGRDPDGNGWATVLRFRDRDGREKTMPIGHGRLASGGAEVRAELADAGLFVVTSRGRADKFVSALAGVKCRRRLTLVAATGWCGERRFVLPSQTVGAAVGERVLFTGSPKGLRYAERGSLAAWRTSVAAAAEDNRLLTFALSLAFLAPLLGPLELEGGGVHLRGASSCGKSTLGFLAGSVWGGGDAQLGFAQTWRATSNALEAIAHGHNHCLLPLDELSQVAPEQAGASAYMLASGQSKARARTDGSLRQRSEWRCVILSNGEVGLADHINASSRGDRALAGQELRLLDVAADAGAGLGVWDTLHGRASGAALSDELRAAAGANHGHAAVAFLEHLIADRTAALAHAKVLIAAFVCQAERLGDTGQAQRGALRFGAIAAAGELAAIFGVVPWRPYWALDTALALYHRWAKAFGRDAPREEREILTRLKAAIEAEGAAFAPWGSGDEDPVSSESPRAGEARGLKTYGYRRPMQDGGIEYLFHDAGWAQVFKGLNPIDAARTVLRAGFLRPDQDGRFKLKCSRKTEKMRLYAVSGRIREIDIEEGSWRPRGSSGSTVAAAGDGDDPLLAAARRAWQALATDAAARFPADSEREPRSRHRELAQAFEGASVSGAVPGVPAVPARNGSEDNDGDAGDWEERAAIAEFEGGANRADAEALARRRPGGEP